MKKPALFILSVLLTLSCQNPGTELDLVITNASIIDLETGTVEEEMLIGINADTIAAIDTMRALEGYESSQLVDAQGQFAMPGLWDNHVHFRGGDSLIEENKNLLPLFLAFGVTTVRDAGGDISRAVLEWRDEIRTGKLVGPNIFSSGPKLDGPEPAWEGSIPVGTQDDVKEALDSLLRLEVDYVKTYDGSLSPEVYYEIIREAGARGLKVTGHMPLSSDIRKAMQFGLDGIEHLYYFLPASSTVGDSLRSLNQGYGALVPLINTYDEVLAKKVMREAAATGFFTTPTLYIGRVLQELYKQDHTSDSLLNYIGPGIIKSYQGRERSAKNRNPEAQEFYVKMEGVFFEMLMPAYESGITLLAGSDCGPYNSYVYPGASLHSELEALVAAGLTPLQALRTSIVNGPAFFGLEEQYGKVAVGRTADLILLRENPLERIENTRSLTTVIQGTRVHHQNEIDDLLQSLKRKYTEAQ